MKQDEQQNILKRFLTLIEQRNFILKETSSIGPYTSADYQLQTLLSIISILSENEDIPIEFRKVCDTIINCKDELKYKLEDLENTQQLIIQLLISIVGNMNKQQDVTDKSINVIAEKLNKVLEKMDKIVENTSKQSDEKKPIKPIYIKHLKPQRIIKQPKSICCNISTNTDWQTVMKREYFHDSCFC